MIGQATVELGDAIESNGYVLLAAEGAEVESVHLSIDKISLTVDLSETDRSRIRSFVKDIKNEAGSHKMPFRPVRDQFYGCGFRIYMNELMAFETTKATAITVQTDSKRPNTRNTLITFNPSKISSMDVAMNLLRNCLNILPQHLANAFVTTIHVALDVPNIRLDDQLMYYPKMRQFRNVYSSGRTHYLGSRFGNTEFAIYDKRAEIKHQNGKLGNFLAQLKTPVPKHDLMRIECRMKPRLSNGKVGHFPLSKLHELPNLFQKMRIHDLPSSLDRFEYVVLSLAKHEGLATARVKSKMSEAEWKAMIRKLDKAGSPEWWQAKQIWNQQFPPLAQELMEPFISEADFPQSLEHVVE